MIIAMQDQCMFNVTMEGDGDKNEKKCDINVLYHK